MIVPFLTEETGENVTQEVIWIPEPLLQLSGRYFQFLKPEASLNFPFPRSPCFFHQQVQNLPCLVSISTTPT